ncbi:MAG: DUF3179 domain-containing protein [Gammaproteobacteria bacterium]|nr:DUF3179 domain-containing protein [Gammaproteobacteria bacterium]MBL4729009.1 DUF3179 domain-containing protein [Gammaproteobacteria bacterium]
MKLFKKPRILTLLLATFILIGSQGLWAQPATINGNLLTIPAVTLGNETLEIVLEIQQGTDPLQLRFVESKLVLAAGFTDLAIFDGSNLEIPQVLVGGVRYRVNLTVLTAETLVLQDVVLLSSEDQSPSCQRPEPDPSHGPNNPQLNSDGFLVPPSEILDGGAGFDGIPAISDPRFNHPSTQTELLDGDMVVGVKIGDQVRAYPHRILDWHEVVNDRFVVEGASESYSITYCPLTGSAMLWKGAMGVVDPTFGVTSLLYNSNQVLFDRESLSIWSQMLEQSIGGPQALAIPERLQVVETSWETWKEMYPNSFVMTTDTGFTRDYLESPYEGYNTSSRTLFPAANLDSRLHPKARVLGINVGDASKVYPIRSFGFGVSVINDTVGELDVVAVASLGKNLGVIFNRQLEDCTTLDFSPVQDQLPIVMIDNEGSAWDVFGNAVSGPRAGTALAKTNSYIAYWFAWSAFFPGAEMHQ